MYAAGVTATDTKGQRVIKLGLGGPYGCKLAMQMQTLTNWTEIANLFKFYKIHRVTYTYTFVHSGSPYQTTDIGTGAGPTILGDALPSAKWVHDKENWAIGTFPDINEYERVRLHQFGPNKRSLSITWKPNLFQNTYDVYSNVSQQAVASQWLDTSEAVNHTGVSMLWYNPDGTNGAEFILTARVRFSVKQMR